VDTIMKFGSFASLREISSGSETVLRRHRFRYWCKSNLL